MRSRPALALVLAFALLAPLVACDHEAPAEPEAAPETTPAGEEETEFVAGDESIRLDTPGSDLHVIDFEDLSYNATSLPDPQGWYDSIPNPMRIDGIVFSDPYYLSTALCPWPACAGEPADPYGSNIVLFINVGATIEFPRGVVRVVLTVQGIGDDPFRFEAADRCDSVLTYEGAGTPYGLNRVEFSSRCGIRQIRLTEKENGPMVLSSVWFGASIADPGDDEGPAPLPDPGDSDEPRVYRQIAADSRTIRLLPELGIFGIAPVGHDVQSSYRRTTAQNREIRRGVVEFAVPVFREVPDAIRLIVVQTSGSFGYHLLSYFDGDSVVTLEDFDRESTVLCTLITRSNAPRLRDTLDVTDLVAAHQGEALGFRFQVVGDLDLDYYGWEGAVFGGLANGEPRLEYRPKR